MESCPECGNLNIVNDSLTQGNEVKKFKWCRNCGWTSDGGATPTPGLQYKGR